MTARPSKVDGRQAARVRHPAGRWRPDLDGVAARFADRLASEGHPWPDLAADVIAERGRAGMDRASFATWLGVSEQEVAAVEDGALADAEASSQTLCQRLEE